MSKDEPKVGLVVPARGGGSFVAEGAPPDISNVYSAQGKIDRLQAELDGLKGAYKASFGAEETPRDFAKDIANMRSSQGTIDKLQAEVEELKDAYKVCNNLCRLWTKIAKEERKLLEAVAKSIGVRVHATNLFMSVQAYLDGEDGVLSESAPKGGVCDGCNVLPPWEHRCHDEETCVCKQCGDDRAAYAASLPDPTP